MKYAIISDSYWDRDSQNYKDFVILMEDLTKEQVRAIGKAYKKASEISQKENKHMVLIEVFIQELNYELAGDSLEDLYYGKIIPMWTFKEFEDE